MLLVGRPVGEREVDFGDAMLDTTDPVIKLTTATVPGERDDVFTVHEVYIGISFIPWQKDILIFYLKFFKNKFVCSNVRTH